MAILGSREIEMHRKILTSITFLALLLSVTSNAIAGFVDNDEALAFASFIQELVHKTQTVKPGVICSIGNDEISRIISQEKNFINLDTDGSKVASCKAIYIAMGREKNIKSDLLKFSNNRILTIAVFDGFIENGGMLQVQMGRRNFELILNAKTLKESGIKLSPLVTDLIIN